MTISDERSCKRKLKLLLVEDDAISRHIVTHHLERFYDSVIIAEDGKEGLNRYYLEQPDIILTDNEMPGMDGIEMIEAIRKTDREIPIILITSSMDSDLLIRSINLNVSSFIPKPINHGTLLKALGSQVSLIEAQKLIREKTEQEFELLKFQERYHSQQEEMAFDKSLHIIENDIAGRPFIRGDKGGEQHTWLCEICYAPLDTMSGDSYSVRRLADGSIVAFLIDAMGKGLSASITAVISTSFINSLIDHAVATAAFDLPALLNAYIDFIRKRLASEEILSAVFMHLQMNEPVMTVASFSMPPLWVRSRDGVITRIPCNNLPISQFFTEATITTHEIGYDSNILLSSDGLNEAATLSGGLYRKQLTEDVRTSFGVRELWRKFKCAVANQEDDVTLLAFGVMNFVVDREETFAVPCRLADVESACSELEDFLLTSAQTTDTWREESSVIIRESLLNAYEHGSLGISTGLKQQLLHDDGYYEYVLQQEKELESVIQVSVALGSCNGERVFRLVVKDAGNGFNPKSWGIQNKNSRRPNGRGLQLIYAYADKVCFNRPGNEITVFKTTMEGRDAVDQDRC